MVKNKQNIKKNEYGVIKQITLKKRNEQFSSSADLLCDLFIGRILFYQLTLSVIIYQLVLF